MSVSVKKLYTNGNFLYKMKLIAGNEGMNNLVQWVHIIEDAEVSAFLNGNELVFTAGILSKEKDWLIKFATNIYNAGASALVVNIGPHTREIPKELIEYCNRVKMPLFTIPWETRMVDMTRDFCQKIMHNEHIEANVSTTIKNVIFKVGDIESQIMQLERYGYQRNSRFTFLAVSIENNKGRNIEEYKDKLKFMAERIAREIKELFLTFSYKGNMVMVLVDYSKKEIETFVKGFIKLSNNNVFNIKFHTGISQNQEGIFNQDKNFEKALCALEMCLKRDEICSYYDELGIYKLLYSVGDKSVLRDYYNETVNVILEYDRKNNTELMGLLSTYLDNNGSVAIVADKLFLHRNTVTNQLKKIEQITGYNPLDLNDRMIINIGYHIKNII